MSTNSEASVSGVAIKDSLEDWSNGFEQCMVSDTQLPYQLFTGEIEKSSNDPHQYRLVRLPNNLVALCVHAPDTKQSTAALSVNVGNFDCPPELPGLAHLLEHMLFLGSKKYPGESEYLDYISGNSGRRNAGTTNNATTFFFTVANDAMEGALDRFSRFFIDPLVKPDCVDREINAVDSEFKGRVSNDDVRASVLNNSLLDKRHPYSRFNMGNKESLKGSADALGLDLHHELLKFHQKYYSSDLMKLVVCGNQSLDQLSEWVVAKFSEIQSKGNTRDIYSVHPMGEEQIGKVTDA
ncbi:metalloprotease [Coemansia sp. RSA 486]|nr:metalloprotease [Coemansia sp. RSA 486]